VTRRAIDAIYEGGVFRPLAEPDLRDGRNVRISVETEVRKDAAELLGLAASVYVGLPEKEIREIEAIALD